MCLIRVRAKLCRKVDLTSQISASLVYGVQFSAGCLWCKDETKICFVFLTEYNKNQTVPSYKHKASHRKTWESNLLHIRLQIMQGDKMRGDTRKAKWPLGRMSVLHKQSLWVAVGNIHGKWQALDVSLSILWNSTEQILGQSPTHVNAHQPCPHQAEDARRKLHRRAVRFLWSLSVHCSVFTKFS